MIIGKQIKFLFILIFICATTHPVAPTREQKGVISLLLKNKIDTIVKKILIYLVLKKNK